MTPADASLSCKSCCSAKGPALNAMRQDGQAPYMRRPMKNQGTEDSEGTIPAKNRCGLPVCSFVDEQTSPWDPHH